MKERPRPGKDHLHYLTGIERFVCAACRCKCFAPPPPPPETFVGETNKQTDRRAEKGEKGKEGKIGPALADPASLGLPLLLLLIPGTWLEGLF